MSVKIKRKLGREGERRRRSKKIENAEKCRKAATLWTACQQWRMNVHIQPVTVLSFRTIYNISPGVTVNVKMASHC